MIIKWVDYDCKIIDPIAESVLIHNIEQAYRICYNSEEKMREEKLADSLQFIRKKIKAGHLTPLEHTIFTMKSVMDRGVMAELTRHRIGSSFNIESTRYISYDGDIECIMPTQLRNNEDAKQQIIRNVENSCITYQSLLKSGITPQNARAVLPMCLKTKVMHSHNLRELFHILQLRYFGITGAPHPDMKYWCSKMLDELKVHYPNIFNLEE